ncbi:hypothetical protein JW758_04510 [Candidatus Peregrinibacteria bacterium]|nr:hypothetical protein [Candidatus Peregrinibacteria bacterium]
MAEMVIVITIIGILFTIGGSTYRNQRNQFQFNDSLTKTLEIIKTARNYAITSRAYWNGATSEIPKEGYGVYIERTAHPNGTDNTGRLVLFANTSTSGTANNQYDNNEGFEEEYLLPLDTNFVGLIGYDSNGAVVPTPNNKVVILFRPPLADVFMAYNPTALPSTPDDVLEITDLEIQLKRVGAPATSPATVIKMNRISGFPEIEL